jgi:hypothetical protein
MDLLMGVDQKDSHQYQLVEDLEFGRRITRHAEQASGALHNHDYTRFDVRVDAVRANRGSPMEIADLFRERTAWKLGVLDAAQSAGCNGGRSSEISGASHHAED